MRIDCPKCGAAFAIDERRVPPKGVRAQCPLCGERVVVRLPGSAPAASGIAAGAAPASVAVAPPASTPAVGTSAPPPTPAFRGPPARPAHEPAPLPELPEPAPRTPTPFVATVADPTLTPGPLALVGSPFAEPTRPGPATKPAPAMANPFGSFDDLAGLTPAPGVPVPAAAPRWTPPADFPPGPGPGPSTFPAGTPGFTPGLPSGTPGAGFTPRPFGDPGPALGFPSPSAGFPAPATAPTLRAPEPTASDILAELAPPPERSDASLSAPAPADDPFADLDPVRELTSPGLDPTGTTGASRPRFPGAGAAPPPVGPDGAVWRIRRAGGGEAAPVNFARLKAMVEAHELAADDQIARGEATFWPVSSHPAVQAILRRSRPVVARADLPTAPRRVPTWAVAAGALAVFALALVAWKSWPRTETPELRLTEEAYARRVAAWKESLPAPPGTAEAHEKKGRALLREDTPDALRSAQEEFRRAVILDPGATGAIAGYVEAGALLGFGPDDREAIAQAKDLVDHAARLAGQDPAVLRANAQLLLSLESAGNLIQARALAETAQQRSGGAPEDLVAVGRSYIGTNVDLALRNLDLALQKDPENRRALLYRGLAKERVARYAAAADDFERRLALAPGDPEALRALLRVTATVGAFDRLRRILDGILAVKPGDPEARLGLGILAYQVEGDARRAAGILAGLVADQTLSAEVRGRAAGHAAALAREAGDLDAAAKLVAGAAIPGAAGAPARYQEALLALGRGKPDEARAALAAVPAGVLDDAERSLLEGRIHLAGTRLRDAVASFQAAQRAAPRRVDPYLFLAAAQAKLGDAPGAFGALRGALDLDPAAGRSRRVLTDFFESPKARLAGLEAPLLALAEDRVDLALAHAAAGIVRYHRGDAAGAVPLLEHALDLDPQAMPALAYLAQIALDRNQAGRALELARTASRLEKLLALGPFLEGRSQEALGRPADARAAYERALAANPSFHPAAVRLGALSLLDGNREEAEKRFFQVFQGDPENAEAKVALFQLGR